MNFDNEWRYYHPPKCRGGMFFLLFFPFLVSLQPLSLTWPFWLYVSVGLIFTGYYLNQSRKAGLSLTEEIFFGISTSDIVVSVLMWPLFWVIRLMKIDPRSYRASYEYDLMDRIRDETSWERGMPKLAAFEAARAKAERGVEFCRRIDESVLNLPETAKVGASCALAAGAIAASSPEEPKTEKTNVTIGGSVYTFILDHFISMRSSRAATTEPVLLSGLSLNFPRQVSMDLAGSWSVVNSPEQSKGNQIDMSISKGFHFESLDLGLCFRWKNNDPCLEWEKGDLMLPTVTLGRTFAMGEHRLRPELQLEWVTEPGELGDVSVKFGAGHSWKPSKLPMVISHRESIASESGLGRNEPWQLFFQEECGINWRLFGGRLEITFPAVKAVVPLGSNRDGRVVDSLILTGFRVNF